MSFRIEEDGQFRGTVNFLDAQLQAGAVDNARVKAGAGIDASKHEHQHRVIVAQESATAAADDTRVAHVVHGTTGKLLEIKAGCIVPCVGDDTITFDLLKNGASVLTAKITIDNADAARALVAGVIDTATLAKGDVLEIEVDAIHATGTLGKGPFAYVDLEEDYS